jgi:hypothetical protein
LDISQNTTQPLTGDTAMLSLKSSIVAIHSTSVKSSSQTLPILLQRSLFLQTNWITILKYPLPLATSSAELSFSPMSLSEMVNTIQSFTKSVVQWITFGHHSFLFTVSFAMLLIELYSFPKLDNQNSVIPTAIPRIESRW